jgi:hypothetical protein
MRGTRETEHRSASLGKLALLHGVLSNSGDTIWNSPPLALGQSPGGFGAHPPGPPVRRPPLLDPEPDPPPPRWGWGHQLPDGIEHDLEL